MGERLPSRPGKWNAKENRGERGYGRVASTYPHKANGLPKKIEASVTVGKPHRADGLPKKIEASEAVGETILSQARQTPQAILLRYCQGV